jgi:hypothetical protein
MVVIFVMVDGSSDGSYNGPILAHQMPLAGAVHHITEKLDPSGELSALSPKKRNCLVHPDNSGRTR